MQGKYLIFIRHSHPEMEEGIPAAQWRLSEMGRQRCHRLAARLRSYDLEVIVSSTERKAIETAEITAKDLGLLSRVKPGIHEHLRENNLLGNFGKLPVEDFRLHVEKLLSNPDDLIFGSETGSQALARFSEGMVTLMKDYAGKNLAVVTHGTVLSLYMQKKVGLDPVPFWDSLGLPSFVVLPSPELDVILHNEVID